MIKLKCALAGAAVVGGALVAQATSLTDAYVQDGLVVFWDAIENQGPGQPHSNTPTVWLDATGHGYGLGPYLTLAQPVWTDDGCVFPDSAYTTKTALGCSTGTLLLPAGTAPHTLEFIADAPVVGSNSSGQPGCSHAGKGGANSTTATYDNFKVPSLPGSAGGYSTSNSNLRGGSGGGQVWIETVKDIVVDGTISMNGRATHSGWGGGSGGSVYLRARKVSGSGTISVAGGASSTRPAGNWTNNNGGGGGGYITFCTDRFSPVTNTFTGTISVDGGLGKTSGDLNAETGRYATDYRGWPGLVTYLCNPSGLTIYLR